TLTLAVRFKQPLVGKSFTTTLIATDDAGTIQGPNEVGTLGVGSSASFTAFLPLVERP
ncbi:MAG: hypothetical protein H7Y32_01660, partial [Chloroflexales bacterium]|nr:hypothetical protein [Chloroflexales bacterium]